jgi:4-amino-4-deoxychorismate lyase
VAALVDGRPTGVDPADRGLAYGDGVFETMAAHEGRIRWLDYHFDRLIAGCERLGFAPPDLAVLRAEVLAAAAGSGRHVVKVIVTRGVGMRGYAPPATPQPTRIVAKSSWPDYPAAHYTRGIALRTLRLRLAENPALAGIKHLCRLEQVLAQRELAPLGAEEGLLLDSSGFVVGGIGCNIFGVYGTRLVTPALERCGVKGVMRRVILEAAPPSGLTAVERDLTALELLDADEVFVTNALFGIWPVIDIDGRPKPRGVHAVDLLRRLGLGTDA